MRPSIDPSAKRSYYRAALLGLRHVEARRPTRRRFGADADALWRSQKGHLLTADRIDLLLRDADAEWPSAFGARAVFDLPGLSEDEPFGADWEALDGREAEALWRGLTDEAPPASMREALLASASAWELELRPVDLPAVEPADRILVVGPSAIAALSLAFEAAAGLDWSEQVTAVASAPAHRQLAALAAAWLSATKPTRLVRPGAAAAPKGAKLVVSEDADPADLAWAKKQVGGGAC